MQWFHDVPIGIKLVTSYVLVALIAAFIGGFGIVKLMQLNEGITEVYEHNTRPLGNIGLAGITFQRSRVNIRGMMLDDNQQRMEANAATIRKNDGIIDQEMSTFEKAVISTAIRKEIDSLKTLLGSYRTTREEMITAALGGDREGALGLMRSEVVAKEKAIDGHFATLLELTIKEAGTVAATNASGAKKTVAETILIVIVGAVLAVVFGLFMTRFITGPIRMVVDLAHAIANGDLTSQLQLDRKDETGQLARAMNGMIEHLRQIMVTIGQNSNRLAAAAGNLTQAAEQMATGTEQVASQAGTVAVASEEMAATSTEIAANCSMAAEGARRASSSAEHGSQVVQETVAGMKRIAERVRETARTIDSLGARSNQIGAIIGTIEDIADQTNLLALNAAIEAARAGEQGRGFAVVADEVRALAERTTKATREIGEMIKGIQGETKGAVRIMEEGVREVEAGTIEAVRSDEALRGIIEEVGAVFMQVNQIATAAEEQTATTNEITNNIQQVTEVIHETARGTQESASSAHELANLADELRSVVARFKVAA